MKLNKLYLLLIASIAISCDKNQCSSCQYTTTGTKRETGEQIYYKEGKYSEVDFEAGCEITPDQFETDRTQQLQDEIDYQHSLNPRNDLNLLTFESETWNEDWSYTLECD